MPQQTYSITAPNGKSLDITGDHMPTEAELHEIFKQAGVETGAPPDTSNLSRLASFVGNAGIGVAKGAGNTAVGLGQAVHQIPGVSSAVDALYRLAGTNVNSSAAMASDPVSSLGLRPNGSAQKVGMTLEQMAEFLAPGMVADKAAATVGAKLAPLVSGRMAKGAASILPRVAAQAGTTAAVTAAQGGDVGTAAMVGGALPIVGASAGAVGDYIGSKAEPLVRAAVKPTVSALKSIAGASMTGIDAQAKRLSQFILANRLTTPAKAQAIIDASEQELTALLQSNNPTTDAPQRVARYLNRLKQSAAQQGLGAEDVSMIDAAARKFLKTSPLAEDVTTTVLKPSPSGLVDASGNPVQVPTTQTSRALRGDVTAQEALDRARSTSRWQTQKAYGEQKSTSVEVQKAVERGARDSVKAAVPDARPILARQGQAIDARTALDRMAMRASNRDAVSLPAHVIAAGEIAQGRVPIMALAANWLRNNQLQAGIYADRLASALARNDVKTVSDIMGRVGVGAGVQAANPEYVK